MCMLLTNIPPHLESRHQFGVLVLAQNPYVRLGDAGFNAFVDAAQNSICNSMSSVHSYEQQKQRADQLAQINMAKVRFAFLLMPYT